MLRNIIHEVLRLINSAIKKNAIMFMPHHNCLYDGYDIMNYDSDNVLCLLNYVLHSRQYKHLKLCVVYHDECKRDQYYSYCQNLHDSIEFVYYKDRLGMVKSIISSKIIFVDNIYDRFRYKSNNQKIVCLGYYLAPYKDDYYRIENLDRKGMLMTYIKSINKEFDYHITTSDLSSKLISNDTFIYKHKFLSLGFPRNDIFYNKLLRYRKLICSTLNINPRYIICYAPTHRDYENKNNNSSSTKLRKRTLFGFTDHDDDNKIERLLEKLDAVIIAKVHPIQERSILNNYTNGRIFYYSEIKSKMNVNLQQLLYSSDLLITDYSSTFYDYLNLDRPIVYYTYDAAEYVSSRSFCINPITPFTAGETALTIEELVVTIENVLMNGDPSEKKRRYIRESFIKYMDGNSSERIANYFLSSI